MKILVCVKQVPDPEQLSVGCGADGGPVLGGASALRTNRFDEFAVEAALHLKEILGQVSIDVLSVGPETVLAVVKRAIGMGVDHGVLLLTADGADPGPAAVARRIAGFAGQRRYDLILTGAWSEDGMNGQVGPMTAALLAVPWATQVMALQLTADRRAVAIEREVETGARERLELRLPALLALQPGINRPRYPSLSNLLRANRQPVERVAAEGLGETSDPVVCMDSTWPPRVRAGRVLKGRLEEQAEDLLCVLRERALIPAP
jgi:electron transfer flavoprotein beta subunit